VAANLKPAKLAGEASEAMVLAADTTTADGTLLVKAIIPPGGLALLVCNSSLTSGSRQHIVLLYCITPCDGCSGIAVSCQQTHACCLPKVWMVLQSFPTSFPVYLSVGLPTAYF
jgi:tRNA-binding EMAP/Myf-like protein